LTDDGAQYILTQNTSSLENTAVFLYQEVISNNDPEMLIEMRKANLINISALLNNYAEYLSIVGDFQLALDWYMRSIEVARLLGARQYCWEGYCGIFRLPVQFHPDSLRNHV
jgi:hypothetical protein